MFIKLTIDDGSVLLILAEDIYEILEGKEMGSTSVSYRNDVSYVKESPEEILKLIKECEK